MPPHQQSKCCGCCCTSRIGVFVYCIVFGVLSLLGIVNFFPLPNSSLWFTFMMADIVSSANEYCNTYAISTTAEIGSGESFAGGQSPMSWENYGTPDCSGEPTWSWAEPTFPTDAASADMTCHAVDGGAIQGEWCDYSEEPPQLRGIYFAGISDCYPSSKGEDYAYVADGSCVVDGMGNSLRFYCGVFKEEYSVGRLGTCDEVCMCGELPCDFAAQGAAHESGARLFFASVIMSIVLYIVGGVAACAYHKQALVGFAGGIVLVEILFGVSLIILTMAPMEVFKASFLWATASGYDPNGQASCTITWLTAVDGILGIGTITRCTPRLNPATRRRPARPCHPPPPPARHRASERTQLALLRGPVGHRPRHLRPHALRGVQSPPRHHRGANAHGGEGRPDAGDGDGDGDDDGDGDSGAGRDGDDDGGPDGGSGADGDGGAVGDGGRDGDGGGVRESERIRVCYTPPRAAPRAVERAAWRPHVCV